MRDGEILAALRTGARKRSSFLFSDLGIALGRDLDPGDLLRVLGPYLDILGLSARREGSDLLVTRPPIAPALALSPGELARQAEFLRHPFISPAIQEQIEAYIGRKVGKGWDDPVILDRIRAAIRAQKGEYWDQGRGRAISYRAGYRVIAYLAYQAPAALLQFELLLHGLAADGLLKERMRILDIGAGPGVVAMAIADYRSRLGHGEARIFALEREKENLEAYRFIVPAFASSVPGIRIEEPTEGDIAEIDPENLPENLDLIVFGNVLNELRGLSVDERAVLVRRLSATLESDGTIAILEPADLENSTSLRKLAGVLTREGLTLYAPCTFLWSTACRPDRCWSFLQGPDFQPTRLMERLAAAPDGYRYRNTDLKFSYALLRTDSRTRVAYRVPLHAKALRLSKLQGHLARRVNVVVAKMSGDLGDRKHHVFRVCDGTPQKPVFAVVPVHHAAAARALVAGGYGDIFSLENVLVRSNPAHDAFNLFVDRGTGVLPLEPGKKAAGSPRRSEGREKKRKGGRLSERPGSRPGPGNKVEGL